MKKLYNIDANVRGERMLADGEWVPWSERVRVSELGEGTFDWAREVARRQIGQPVLSGPGRKMIQEVQLLDVGEVGNGVQAYRQALRQWRPL